MKYELIEENKVGWDMVYKVKCIPGEIGKFFGRRERVETLIYKGSTYCVSGNMVFYNLTGDKVLNSVANWLNSKLHYEKYTKENENSKNKK